MQPNYYGHIVYNHRKLITQHDFQKHTQQQFWYYRELINQALKCIIDYLFII